MGEAYYWGKGAVSNIETKEAMDAAVEKKKGIEYTSAQHYLDEKRAERGKGCQSYTLSSGNGSDLAIKGIAGLAAAGTLVYVTAAASRAPVPAGESFVMQGGSRIRTINLRPSTPKWGLTSQHIDKHLFGDAVTSLKSIDPAGTTDQWMHYLTELFNSPVSGVTCNNKLDIIKTFPKADGSGTFQLGIRLSENADGTFDLVTILTKQ